MNNYLAHAKTLTNPQLHNLILRRAADEREILAEIVSYIAEVDRRRLYFDYNCANLFDYLTREMKYSNGAAQRRIDSARLLHVAPEMKEKFESGELTLEKVTVVASAMKQVKRETGVVCSAETKRELINKVVSLPIEKAQQVVAQHLNIEVKTFDKKTVQKDESVRLEITLSKEESELLKEVKDLLSHSNPGATAKEVLVIALRELKKKKDPTEKGLRRARTSTVEVKSESKQLSAREKNLVFTKHKCCQWKFSNGQVCGSTFQLEVDHIQSRWLGGGNEIENFQVLCSAHNKLKYREEIGLH